MPKEPPRCPVCQMSDDSVGIAVHLMDAHQYPYEKAQDWMRNCEKEKQEVA